jgi:hypothetical protein
MKLESPDELREYALKVVTELKIAGFDKQSFVLNEATILCTLSAWEWLGEINLAVKKILWNPFIPVTIRFKLWKIRRITSSGNPYS